jgi:predicted RecB family nuclease
VAKATLIDVTGVGPAGATKLRRAGFRTVEALAAADLAEIAAVPGFGPATAATLRASARELSGPPSDADPPAGSDPADGKGKWKKGKN